jgi:phosphatidylserine/phosphatidylglycerophosphate/cardiolipin synthase-like enzyme
LPCLLLALLPALALAEPLPARGSVEALFTPWDDAEGALLRTVGAAKKAIHVQAFLLTSRNVGRALIDAHRRGVDVAVLADREMVANGENSQIPKLAEAGIPVWLEVRYQSAHNKIVLVDPEEAHPIVVTGSYNFTFSAQARNAENLLILRDNAPLARAYLANWRRHRGEAIAYGAGEGR